MQKIVLIIAIAMEIAVNAAAQKLDPAKVPAPVKSAFEKKCSGTVPKWENEKGLFEAGFKDHGKDKSMLFSADGTVVETETGIRINELPGAVHAYVNMHYKGAEIKEAAKIINADGILTYEAEVNKTELIFDDKGNFLKETKD